MAACEVSYNMGEPTRYSGGVSRALARNARPFRGESGGNALRNRLSEKENLWAVS